MSAIFAPGGFQPAFHPTGLDRAAPFAIAAAYNTPIYKYGMCTLNTNCTVTIAAVAADFLGVFDGVQWIDAQQKPNYSNFWPGAQTGATEITAWVWSDPSTVFLVQADGSIAQTAVGDQADATTATIASGSTSTGLSTSSLSSTLSGAGVQGQWRIVGFGTAPDNAPGDAYTTVQVQIARSQFVSNKTAV
jgi:hypothetical protein